MQGEWNRIVRNRIIISAWLNCCNISTGLDNIILLYRIGAGVYTMYKSRTDYMDGGMYQTKLINIFTI